LSITIKLDKDALVHNNKVGQRRLFIKVFSFLDSNTATHIFKTYLVVNSSYVEINCNHTKIIKQINEDDYENALFI
jgi:hypothetical protein